jgi:hypothetical protein
MQYLMQRLVVDVARYLGKRIDGGAPRVSRLVVVPILHAANARNDVAEGQPVVRV